ncbi:MAG: hypothetical protein OHK0012_15210 [Synechococcales cyanobacterium]
MGVLTLPLPYPVGTIVELIGHDTPHCGVVLTAQATVELLAQKDWNRRRMICRLVLIQPDQINAHPLTHHPPRYRLWQGPPHAWTTPQLCQHLRQIWPHYEGQDYHIIFQNCQHFAWELSTGRRCSPDGDPVHFLGTAIAAWYHLKDFGPWVRRPTTSHSSIPALHQDLVTFLGSQDGSRPKEKHRPQRHQHHQGKTETTTLGQGQPMQSP